MVPQLSGLPDEIGDKIKVDIEICCRQECELDLLAVKQAAMSWLSSVATVRYTEGPISPPPGEFPVLDNNVESIKIVDLTDQAKPNCQLLAWDVAWEVSRGLLGDAYAGCSFQRALKPTQQVGKDNYKTAQALSIENFLKYFEACGACGLPRQPRTSLSEHQSREPGLTVGLNVGSGTCVSAGCRRCRG